MRNNKHPGRYGKRFLGAWISPVLRDFVQDAAREQCIPVAEYLELLLRAELKRHDTRVRATLVGLRKARKALA